MNTIQNAIAEPNSLILITGANGFVGTRVVSRLLKSGYCNLRCLVRPSSDMAALQNTISDYPEASVDIYKGNLLSGDDCKEIARDAGIIIHLAAGIDKSFPGAFMNSVVTTRNLLNAVVEENTIKRFVNISSFAVYSNFNMPRNSMLDESCEVDPHPERRFEAYTYGKFKQDQLLLEYHEKYNLPYVIVRPSVVFGPGKRFIPSRVGIDTFGFFIHIGGPIEIPLTYVDNCAEAIVMTAFKKGIEGEVFNIVDDDLPTSRTFLKLYKKNVKWFFSIYLPYPLFYFFSFLWEAYAKLSKGQLPPVFSRRRCAIYWKGNRYPNQKLKDLVGWQPRISFTDALQTYFNYQRKISGK